METQTTTVEKIKIDFGTVDSIVSCIIKANKVDLSKVNQPIYNSITKTTFESFPDIIKDNLRTMELTSFCLPGIHVDMGSKNFNMLIRNPTPEIIAMYLNNIYYKYFKVIKESLILWTTDHKIWIPNILKVENGIINEKMLTFFKRLIKSLQKLNGSRIDGVNHEVVKEIARLESEMNSVGECIIGSILYNKISYGSPGTIRLLYDYARIKRKFNFLKLIYQEDIPQLILNLKTSLDKYVKDSSSIENHLKQILFDECHPSDDYFTNDKINTFINMVPIPKDRVLSIDGFAAYRDKTDFRTEINIIDFPISLMNNYGFIGKITDEIFEVFMKNEPPVVEKFHNDRDYQSYREFFSKIYPRYFTIGTVSFDSYENIWTRAIISQDWFLLNLVWEKLIDNCFPGTGSFLERDELKASLKDLIMGRAVARIFIMSYGSPFLWKLIFKILIFLMEDFCYAPTPENLSQILRGDNPMVKLKRQMMGKRIGIFPLVEGENENRILKEFLTPCYKPFIANFSCRDEITSLRGFKLCFYSMFPWGYSEGFILTTCFSKPMLTVIFNWIMDIKDRPSQFPPLTLKEMERTSLLDPSVDTPRIHENSRSIGEYPPSTQSYQSSHPTPSLPKEENRSDMIVFDPSHQSVMASEYSSPAISSYKLPEETLISLQDRPSAVYIINDGKDADCFKIGVHTGIYEDLSSRYLTGTPRVEVRFYQVVINKAKAHEIELKVKHALDYCCILNINGNRSEWFRVDFSLMAWWILKFKAES